MWSCGIQEDNRLVGRVFVCLCMKWNYVLCVRLKGLCRHVRTKPYTPRAQCSVHSVCLNENNSFCVCERMNSWYVFTSGLICIGLQRTNITAHIAHIYKTWITFKLTRQLDCSVSKHFFSILINHEFPNHGWRRGVYKRVEVDLMWWKWESFLELYTMAAAKEIRMDAALVAV